MRFRRSEGLTRSERVLAELCDRSFLKLWTYPNLFKKPNKELTDLLVVFGHHVIVFSDKSCSYPDTGRAELDWSRWYRKSIEHSVHQIEQAERWLRTYPQEIYLDAKCVMRLPLALPATDDMHIHRVCVALGATERAQLVTGSRSLIVDPTVLNDAEPFRVGRPTNARGWVHVFDEATLTVVLTELSTASDFVNYLTAKEVLLDGGQFIFAESETDIMAYYLWNGRKFPASAEPFRLNPKLWAQVENSPPFLAGRSNNRVSFFWDGLIEYITDHYLNETLEVGNELDISDYEQMARVMAGETRFFRRILSKWILERVNRVQEQAISSLMQSEQSDVIYVLYVGCGDKGSDHTAYRADRASRLRLRCVAAKAAEPEKRYIIGIAMDARGVRGTSEDFLLMDTKDWTVPMIEKAKKMRKKLGYFLVNNTIETMSREDEYTNNY
jgi:hypothetical protein